MKTLFTVCLSLVLSYLFSQTVIYDKQEVSGKWTTKGSPYIIKGEAIVPQGKTLKISPGVVVRFQTGETLDYDKYSKSDLGFLRVNGRLIAKGKQSNLIYFTREGSYGNWGVVYLNTGKQKNLLSNCKFEYGYLLRSIIPDDNATAVVSFNNCQGLIQHCIIVNNGWNGINCKNGANPLIKNNTLTGNKYAIECNSNSSPLIQNTIIYSNDDAFYVNGGAKPMIMNSLIQLNSLPLDVNDLGENIYNEDPLFVDRWSGNYRLQKSSPCRGKGKGGVNIGAY